MSKSETQQEADCMKTKGLQLMVKKRASLVVKIGKLKMHTGEEEKKVRSTSFLIFFI